MFAAPPSLRLNVISSRRNPQIKTARAKRVFLAKRGFLAKKTFAKGLLAAGLLVVLSPAAALADCQTDIQGFMKRRDAIINQLKGMSKGKKKQLDATEACPKLRSLASVLGETVAYFEKNKDWCQIPDNFLEGAKQQRTQFSGQAGQACKVAAQIAKMKKQAARQAAEGGVMGGPQVQQLPHGPL